MSNDAIVLATDSEKNARSALEVLTAREPKYVRLLKKAQEILSTTQTSQLFETIDKLTLKNKEIEAEMLSLKRERITAPETSYNPFINTKKRIDQKLIELPREIENNKNTIDSLQDEIIESLRAQGITISKEELNYCIISAEGSELVKLMNIAENMKKIQYIIEKELQKDKNNVDLAKYYTGMYLISLESYATAHDLAIEKIAKYKKSVKKIINEALANHKEAQSLRDKATASDIKNIEANIKINEQVIRVGEMYERLLVRRTHMLTKAKEQLSKRVQLAANTYKTIVNGSSLLSLVDTESREFSLLVNFDVPELKLLYDSAMLNAFVDIAEKIKNES